MHLLVAVFLCRLLFVKPLQRAVMLLVEPPALRNRHPILIQLVEYDAERLHGPFQVGGIGMPEQKALLAQQQAGLFGLGDAFFAQIDVRPSR